MSRDTRDKHTQGQLAVFNQTDIFTLERHGRTNDGFQVADCNVDYSSDADPGLTREECRGNARRLTACWNACVGIPTDILENPIMRGALESAHGDKRYDTLRRKIKEIIELLDELEGSFDEQTFDERKREDFNAPDDREYSVIITAKQLRAISAAITKATT